MRITYVFVLLVIFFGFHRATYAGHENNKITQVLPNFTPGNYKLSTPANRELEPCGDGEFKIVNDGKNIILGVKHAFSLNNSMEKTIATDDPEEKGCIYINSNSYSVEKETTLLSSKESLNCDGVERHHFVETAIITKEKIHLEFKQSSNESANAADNSIEYQCDWKLVKRSSPSKKKAK